MALAGCEVLPGRLLGPAPDAPEPHNAAPSTPPDATPPETAARTPPEMRPVNDDPDRLKGINEDALRHLLGQPGFMRRDIPALLYRYAGKDCILDVFLYRSRSSGPFTVTHLAARSTDGTRSIVSPVAGEEINPRVCLGDVLRARQSAQARPTG